ncbi:MAG TPA: tyrosine-type recombinase/integrase [Xanthomonadaceae bacterium]|jgi:integrase
MARRTESKSVTVDLRTVDRREKLKPRPSKEPYWQPLSAGQYLGFRPSTVGATGTWLARFYDGDTGKKPNKTLGGFGTLPANKRFDAAKREAEAWFKHLSHGGSTDDVTVKQACEAYAEGSTDAAARFRRRVYSDPIAKVKLTKLSKEHVRQWRKRLAATPAIVALRKVASESQTRSRTDASVNRDMTALRAALNAAKARDEVTTDAAWVVPLKPIEGAGKRRNVYLDREQRRALLSALPVDAGAFVKGLCLLPLRPGALAGLTVGDFDKRRKELVVGKDKQGADRRILVPDMVGTLLTDQSKNKLPAAPLFARADGKAWDKDSWKYPIKDAAKAAGLPVATTAYTLRHSAITDLVTGGLDLLTVAILSGTSWKMIQDHYGHLQQERAAAALAALAL